MSGRRANTDNSCPYLHSLRQSWGGSFLTAYLSGNIPVQLLSVTPLLTYVSVHFYLTILMSYVPVSAVWLDTLMPLIDGATRTMAVVGGVTLARTNMNPLAAQSLLFQILLGTVGACGGGQLAGTLNVFNPDLVGWSFSTPPILKSRNIIEAIDVIAALLGSITFTIFTGSHPAWTPLLARAGLVVPSKYTRSIFHWSDAEGKAATTLVIAACFAYRALLTHWSTLAPKSVGQRVEIEQKKEKKGVKSAAIGGGKGAK